MAALQLDPVVSKVVPVLPADPVEPVDPVLPADPVDPADPVLPAGPVEPEPALPQASLAVPT